MSVSRRQFLASLAAATVASQVRAAEQPQVGWTLPSRASQLAMVDLGGLPPGDRYWQRYLWIADGSRETAAAVSYSLNAAISFSATIQRPTPVSGSQGILLRIDLRRWCPKDSDLKRLLRTWEKLSVNEPWFHATSFTKVSVAPYKADDGKTYDFRYARQFALASNVNALMTMQAMTGSSVPIVEARWFMGRMLTTLDQGHGVGLYYDFRGIEKNPANGADGKKRTAQDAFFESLGASNVNLGQRAADEKAGIFKSKVTGKPRVVVAFYGTNVRPSAGLPLVTATLDITDDQVKRKQHPIYNLVKFDFAATEVIGVLPNGFFVYALFNNKGELQTSVPDTIASDNTIPAPETVRLQPAIGCIRCHGPKEGMQPFGNDVLTLLRAPEAQPTIDVKELAKGKSLPDVIEQIRGLYTGDLAPVINQVRNNHHTAAFYATGGLWLDKSSSGVAAEVSRSHAQYFYEPVTSAVACKEIGNPLVDDVTDKEAAQTFARMVPALPGDDPTIIALRNGIAVIRSDFEHVLPDVLLRSIDFKVK